MATAAELQKKLQDKLKELFQLDQPDLDFGFYRVMHAKQKEITEFLDVKLPAIIAAAFKDSSAQKVKADFDAAKHALISGLGEGAFLEDGTINPAFASAPLAQQYVSAQKALAAADAGCGAEADVYDHLYHFFERYYDKGDFVSLRYLTRETDKHAKPYAIPYAGEEVMLHWANADQYYVKTSENFSHFTFDAAKHPDVAKMNEMERMAKNVPASLKVHFEIVDADEGDHGNIKAGKDRFFVLHEEKKCEIRDGEVYIYFEYREDPEQEGQTAKWQEKRRAKAIEALKSALTEAGLGADVRDFLYLDLNGGDKKKGERLLLDVYLKKYFARNTSDYFIHKDLGGFLRRELDFYIKNDLMILDNVTAATPETVAKWLGLTKVFRSVAQDIITFLAQLEDFQKKLWLKKKFVVQCDYCLTMDLVPDELKPEVLANEKQLAAWKKLGTDVDPKSLEKAAIDARMVDTQYFDEVFKQRLISNPKTKKSLDELCGGVLVHSDNFQGLSEIRESVLKEIDYIYIDPPYNSKTSRILYKNDYVHSSWLSLIRDRLVAAKELTDGPVTVAIDENELEYLGVMLRELYPLHEKVCVSVVHNKKGIQGKYFSTCHESAFFMVPEGYKLFSGKKVPKNEWEYTNLRKWGSDSDRSTAKHCYYPIYIKDGEIESFGELCREDEHPGAANILLKDGRIAVYPFETSSKTEKKWRYERDTVESIRYLLKVVKTRDGEYQIHKAVDEATLKTIWDDARYIAGDNGTKWLTELGLKVSDNLFPKSLFTVEDSISSAATKDANVLDYFGGSGTTAHAVIDLNRQDGGKRKYILIEMGDHFDTVLMPRVQKVVYSPEWKDGKAVASTRGISHCFKYLRLESYEDALNNLVVDGSKGAAFSGVRDYFLKYMLDVETKGSPSLLNIADFANPFGYKLVVKKPGSEEREERVVDLVETFDYLIGLRVQHMAAMQSYAADFERAKDPELPEDGHTKLTVKGAIRRNADGAWKFRVIEGWVPRNRFTPNDGAKDRVLIVWRTLTDDREKDNAVLDYYLQHKADVNPLSGDYDVIYINGSNNVQNLRKEEDAWKVRLIEEDFQSRMWEGL